MNNRSWAASWIVFSALTASAQGTTDTPEFEVASVKVAVPQDRGPLTSLPGPVADMIGFDGGPGTKDPGRIKYHGVSLKVLLARAYNATSDQISGPSWLDSERYTIEAKLPPGTDGDQLRLMLQKLLTQRFQISLHREMKETPVYRLRVAKNGPKLQPPEQMPHYQNDADKQEALRKGAEANLAKRMAAMEANRARGIKMPSRSLGMARTTMERFAGVLSGYLDRPVKDMTQLEGEYSLKLAWTPDTNDEPSEFSIFTAIQEQVGLKLETGKESIELLVIDKAEKVPTSN